MKITCVNDLIFNWTEEEREHFAPLIEECRIREARVKENTERSNKQLNNIRNELEKANEEIQIIQNVLDDRIGELAEAIYQITKRKDNCDGNA